MIYRRRECMPYRRGFNWFFERGRGRWWFALVLALGNVHVGFRYRSWVKPRWLNYSRLRSRVATNVLAG